MLLILALFAFQVGEPLLITDEIVSVAPSGLSSVDVVLRQRPATVECSFQVAGDHPGVRAILMTSTDAERFRNERSHGILASTGYRPEGTLRVPISQPGDYQVVLDNRLEGHRAAQVRLKVWLTFPPESTVTALFATKGRQAASMGLSFLFFMTVAVFAGWKIRASLTARSSRRQPPPFF